MVHKIRSSPSFPSPYTSKQDIRHTPSFSPFSPPSVSPSSFPPFWSPLINMFLGLVWVNFDMFFPPSLLNRTPETYLPFTPFSLHVFIRWWSSFKKLFFRPSVSSSATVFPSHTSKQVSINTPSFPSHLSSFSLPCKCLFVLISPYESVFLGLVSVNFDLFFLPLNRTTETRHPFTPFSLPSVSPSSVFSVVIFPYENVF